MSAIMFDGFVSPVEAIATSVTVPVSSTYFLCAFYWTNNITLITAAHNTQTCAQQTQHSTGYWLADLHCTILQHWCTLQIWEQLPNLCVCVQHTQCNLYNAAKGAHKNCLS